MPSPGLERTVRQSVLDRLVDLEPKASADRQKTWEQSVRELKQSLLRDLDWLFNTRRIAQPAPDEYSELQRSVYHFGLIDITSLSGDSELVRRQLTREIEEAVRQFEPRLDDVRVTLRERDEENRRQIRFHVEGLLRMEPNPERIAFDTVLETSSGEFLLADEPHA